MTVVLQLTIDYDTVIWLKSDIVLIDWYYYATMEMILMTEIITSISENSEEYCGSLMILMCDILCE